MRNYQGAQLRPESSASQVAGFVAPPSPSVAGLPGPTSATTPLIILPATFSVRTTERVCSWRANTTAPWAVVKAAASCGDNSKVPL